MTYHDKRGLAALKAAGDHLRKKDAGDPFDILARKIGDMADATKERLQKASDEIAGIDARLDTIETKTSRPKGFFGGTPEPMTWGQEFTKSREGDLRDLANTNSGKVQLNVKAITSDPASAGTLNVLQRDAISMLPKRRLTIRDLLGVISISSGSVEYVNQLTRPGSAATVMEGALKPESDMTLELKTTSAEVIAHWIKASRQILEDAPQLRDLIDVELRYGLSLSEETQILLGDGSAANLLGLIPSATAFADPLAIGASASPLDTIGSAMLQTALTDFIPDGIVMHPSDWMRMRLLKDADGKYILGNPQTEVTPMLFGLPVVATQAMAVDTFLVGSFASAATLYDRWQPRVEVGYVNDDFTRNLVTVLAEERIALAVKQPLALTYGEFGIAA
ncbi:HK97 family phage major capsid protein [Palleronia aestuarii]|uniref:HK97 family phage major capsid protein n=1 Tax=Palleronia aestuarii TaxID=568105 RepID=A0A2W7NEA2_9RHOB|nr:phage major capsid protein [Palleronia aestuarii]PZX18755.1 HK97 family phage major capsid protein [Palleronia aestuarii]